MPVYDEEKESDDLPKSLEEKEVDSSGTDNSNESSSQRGSWRTPWNKHNDAANEEKAELNAGLGKALNSAREKDQENDSFFKDDDKNIGRFKRAESTFGAIRKNRKLLAGAGIIAVPMIALMSGLFGFLNIFKLDHFFENIDSQTFSRFNASFDSRSDTWTRSYIKLRLAELNGDVNTENNPVFRARKVDTDNPMRDWYRTMRTSKFEADLAKKGITFQNQVDSNGNIRFVTFKINDKDVIPDLTAKQLRGGTLENLINSGDYDKDIDFFFVGENNKDARRLIKRVVDENTNKWNVLKRRHYRKDIANMTGIQSWRLFEKSRDKIDQKKINMQKKILAKVFPKDSNTGKFLKCIFGVADCPATTDPADPDNKFSSGSQKGGKIDDEEDTTKETNPDGTETNTRIDGQEAVDGVEKATKEATEEAVDDAAAETIQLSARQEVARSLIGQINDVAGSPYTKIWTWAKKLAKIDSLFKGGDKSKISKLVMTARLAQAVALYSTYAIAKDQIKSGQLVGDELTSFFETTNNMDKSEAWTKITQAKTKTTAFSNPVFAAEEIPNPTDLPNIIPKKDYCSPNHVKTIHEYQHLCDDQKPNSGGRAETISNAYENSVGIIIGPIADAVKKVEESVVGKILNFGQGLVDQVVGAVVTPILNASGLADNMTDLIGFGMSKLTEFLGVGPMQDGAIGTSNISTVGSAGLAESTTRNAGGVAQTVLSRAYSNKLAANFKREQQESKSLLERYASIHNPDSLVANSLYAAANSEPSTVASSLISSINSLPKQIASMFTSRVGAQETDASDIADFVGVNKYDIPQQCIDLDPLSKNYLAAGTNADEELGIRLNYELANNSDTFWKAVYDKIGNVEDAQARAEKIWNCHLLDNRVRGSLGNVYGYTKDNAYGDQSNATPQNTTSNPNLYFLGDSLTVGLKSAGLDQKLSELGWKPTSNGLGSRKVQGGPAPDGITQLNQDSSIVASAGTIIVALGTNHWGENEDTFKNTLQKMYDAVKSKAPNAAIWWVNYSGKGQYADPLSRHNSTLQAFAQEKGVKIIDWSKIAQQYLPDNDVHPSDYKPMVDLIALSIGRPQAGVDLSGLPTGTVPIEETAVTQLGGGIRLYKGIVAQVDAMLAAAKAAGVNLTGSGWRDNANQIRLRIAHGCGGGRIYDRSCKGSPPTAVPGRSMHEKGLAIDFDNCSRGSACFQWLSNNASQYGLKNLPSEPWHWSTTGN